MLKKMAIINGKFLHTVEENLSGKNVLEFCKKNSNLLELEKYYLLQWIEMEQKKDTI